MSVILCTNRLVLMMIMLMMTVLVLLYFWILVCIIVKIHIPPPLFLGLVKRVKMQGP